MKLIVHSFICPFTFPQRGKSLQLNYDWWYRAAVCWKYKMTKIACQSLLLSYSAYLQNPMLAHSPKCWRVGHCTDWKSDKKGLLLVFLMLIKLCFSVGGTLESDIKTWHELFIIQGSVTDVNLFASHVKAMPDKGYRNGSLQFAVYNKANWHALTPGIFGHVWK